MKVNERGEKMKKKTEGFGSNPYATVSGGRIQAPNKPKDAPKSGVVRGTDDLRK